MPKYHTHIMPKDDEQLSKKNLAIGIPLIVIGSILTAGLLPLGALIYLLIQGIATKNKMNEHYRDLRNDENMAPTARPDNETPTTVSYPAALRGNIANFCHFFYEPKKKPAQEDINYGDLLREFNKNYKKKSHTWNDEAAPAVKRGLRDTDIQCAKFCFDQVKNADDFVQTNSALSDYDITIQSVKDEENENNWLVYIPITDLSLVQDVLKPEPPQP